MDFKETVEVVKNIWDMAGPAFIKIVIAIAIWIVGKRLIKVVQRGTARVLAKSTIDISVVKFLQSLVSFLLKVLLILTIIQTLGIPTTGFVAIIGTLSLTIGLSLQGSLSNFAGGILLLIFKPFKVGDYIVEDSYKNEGIVLAIDLLYTKLLTVDNKLVVIPNGAIANTSLTNVSAEKLRRLDISIGISYDSDLRLAKEILMDIINTNDKVLHNKDKQVFVKSLDASCVTLETRVWINSEHYWELKWELLEKYKLEFDKAGIQIPFNQIDVHMKTE